jgi:hypothetical protein
MNAQELGEKHRANRIGIIAVVLLIVTRIVAGEAAPSPDVLSDPPRSSFLLVPLHVHVLSCTDHEDLDCKLDDVAVRRIIGKVNGIWHRAGIHFRLAPILHEKADTAAFEEKLHADALGDDSLGPYRLLASAETRTLAGLHVYYIHDFAVNGVFLGGGMCMIKETARLRPVKGGIDEPLPRVTSHELGHAMGLPHRQDTTNLMASGTTGTILNEAEVEIVRSHVTKIPGTMTVDECETKAKEATAKNDHDQADALRHDLDDLSK